jgi:aminoglycoside phosphotransferase (APT) family kinase protein
MSDSGARLHGDVIDLRALEHWMDGVGLGAGAVEMVTTLTGGSQNILIRFTRGKRDFVLRRPPIHSGPAHDDSIRREAKVLFGLATTDVPHPQFIAACDDRAILGSAFFLMEPIEGFNAADGLPSPFAEDANAQASMSCSLVDALATLSRIDPFEVGLATPDRARGWCERQVARWISQLNSYEQFDGWPGGDIANLGEVCDLLNDRSDVSFKPGFVHGDFHVANVMFRYDRPEVAAIVDWELATFGDPLLDLGHLLATWPRHNGRASAATVLDVAGFVSGESLVERYAHKTSRGVDDLDWYYSLACLRLGVLLEGTYARACAGLIPMDVGLHFHDMTVALFEQGLHRFDW